MIDDPSTDSLLLVMEHVDGGSLEQPYDAATKTWETLPESLVHRHFRELCKVPIYSAASCALHSPSVYASSIVPDSTVALSALLICCALLTCCPANMQVVLLNLIHCKT